VLGDYGLDRAQRPLELLRREQATQAAPDPNLRVHASSNDAVRVAVCATRRP